MSQTIQMPTPTNSLPIPSAQIIEMSLRPTDKFDVSITNVDDQVTCILNGKVVFIAPFRTSLTVTINDEAKMTGLNVGMNTLTLLVYNFTGPTSLYAKLNGQDISFSQAENNNNQSRPVWYQTYNILVAPQRVKVNNPGEKAVNFSYQRDSNATPIYSGYDAPVGGNLLLNGNATPITQLPAGHKVFYLEVDHNGLSTVNSEDAPDKVEVSLSAGTEQSVEFYYDDPKRDCKITMSLL